MEVDEVLFVKPSGYLSELVDMFGDEKVKQLELIGVIRTTPSERGYTYSVTRKANQFIQLLHRPRTLWDYLTDFYFKYIKRVDFKLY